MRILPILLLAGTLLSAQAQQTWVGTWAAAMTSGVTNPPDPKSPWAGMQESTLRQIIHTSAGGTSVRIRLANTFSAEPITVGAAQIALRQADSTIQPASSKALLFSGKESIIIPPGASVLSDPSDLAVPALTDVAVSFFLPGTPRIATIHSSAQQTSFIALGNQVKAEKLSAARPMQSWLLLSGVDVRGGDATGAVATFGDSITDGAKSTNDTNHRWPDVLASRLQTAQSHVATLNVGIGGNRLLHDGQGPYGPAFGPNGLERIDRDIFGQAGVKYVIELLGINDIGQPGTPGISGEVTADEVIAGLQQLIERCHEKGIQIFLGTLTPFKGAKPPYYLPAKQAKWTAINDWIRSNKQADGFVDFAKAVADPNDPMLMDKRFDSGDGLHPSDAGYQAMGEAINLTLFAH